jgi:hypothetical protein
VTKLRTIDVHKSILKNGYNFRAPDLSQEIFSGGLDIRRTYKNCSKNKRKFKMQQSLLKNKT